MIRYRTGDATRPHGDGLKIIAHICNDAGGWGAGFVVAISDRWEQPENAYRLWSKVRTEQGLKILQNPTKGKILLTTGEFELGRVQLVQVEPETYVLNMIAQTGYGSGNRRRHKSDEPDDLPPIRYEALAKCLEAAHVTADMLKSMGEPSFHMPRIGCGLAGGRWDRVEPLLVEKLSAHEVTVYDLPK